MPKARASQPYVDDELKKAFSLPDLPPPSESKVKPNSTAKTFSPPSQSAFAAVVNFFSNPLATLQGKQDSMAGFQYPGVNLPLNTSDRFRFDQLPPVYAIGMPQARGATSMILPIREVAMMLVMEKLTDKPNWHEKVFDETIVQKWREEARTQSENGLYSRIMEGKTHWNTIPTPQSRIISEEAFEFCIAELRNKAAYFVKTGLIPTLDSDGNAIVKSDNLMSTELRDELKQAFETLRADQAGNVDWHPGTNDMVQNLVHPSMYPFVYNRSSFILEEQVNKENAFDFVGKGELVPEITRLADFGGRFINVCWRPEDRGTVPPEYRSSLYQWLPANVAFREDGSTEFTSYINNLHPGKYPAIYKAIEHAIDTALPAWDQCLKEDIKFDKSVTAGRNESRFEFISEADDDDEDLWKTSMRYKRPREFRYNYLNRYRYGKPPQPSRGETLLPGQWVEDRDAILPEPMEFEEIDYTPPQRIQEKFKEHGLQVIVKMASIELTPEKPHFPAGSWHVEGQMNERICATALFYLDSENVTDSHLSFRMQTSAYLNERISTGQDNYNWLERVFGTRLGHGASCIQNYGDVKTCEGRVLAFPNVYQHRVSSFRLKDETKPGHRRFLALWLVDPHERIVSTANVPPQQKDWWTEASKAAEDSQGEILGSLMTVEEAQEHRVKLMHERSRYEEKAKHNMEWVSYNFCEH
ncbi:hypothetical protein T069G_04767 [Trichoderma breve]|uniref:Uncharacterized protein n=1 Tax=Trichoderma breve TaxID=2034170 RepID=A0A9W9BEB5_9HYPO|nr:hypothetical protein T069G_04767 [Trichoderma breve]KAJ4859779.1 hypothetical protein T069G_04767 [Trichoderma breve]